VIVSTQLLKPIPQRERAQWEVGVGHAEDAFVMTKQERIDNYTFIYVDPDPNQPPPAKKPPIARVEKRTQRSASASKKEEGGVTSPDREQPAAAGAGAGAAAQQQPRRQLPRRQCSIQNANDGGGANAQASDGERGGSKRGDPGQSGSPASDAVAAASEGGARQDSSPPPVRAWKTAAARKLLPLSITMKKLNVEITKCDWPLLQRKVVPSPKREREEEEDKEERVEGEVRQPDLGYCSPEVRVKGASLLLFCILCKFGLPLTPLFPNTLGSIMNHRAKSTFICICFQSNRQSRELIIYQYYQISVSVFCHPNFGKQIINGPQLLYCGS